MGRLARWLRVLGHDAEWTREADVTTLLDRAAREARILLTRDTRLVQRRAIRRGKVQAVLVRPNDLVAQLRQLQEDLGLKWAGPPRCLICNGVLESRQREEVKDRVPPYVALTQSHFSYCPNCDRITW
ncbi:MAG: hypothetical protein H5T84_01355, partial [Thermoleophilia bacterium]|nr:hypothetical protein [Thermoleophilia bacterium]